MALAKATIKGTEGAKPSLEVQFNPKELQVDKTVSWTPAGGHEENPTQEFKEPQSSTLNVTLYFDTYETKKDVADVLKPLEAMATIDPKLGRPPLVLFAWGRFVFQGVVESLSQKFTMFLEDGTRCRCEVGLKMKSARGAKSSAKQ
jgi:hypothetical protein